MCAGLVGSALAVRLSEIPIERLVHWDVLWEQAGDDLQVIPPCVGLPSDYQVVPVLLPA